MPPGVEPPLPTPAVLLLLPPALLLPATLPATPTLAAEEPPPMLPLAELALPLAPLRARSLESL